MSKQELSAFLSAIKDNTELQERLKSSTDLECAVSLAKESGFDINKADLVELHKQTLDLSDEELESVAGGTAPVIIGLLGTLTIGLTVANESLHS